jgi:hypothetical protein
MNLIICQEETLFGANDFYLSLGGNFIEIIENNNLCWLLNPFAFYTAKTQKPPDRAASV